MTFEINRDNAQEILDTYEAIRNTVFEIIEDSMSPDLDLLDNLWYDEELACFGVVLAGKGLCDCCDDTPTYYTDYVSLDEVVKIIEENRTKRIDGH